MCATLATCAFNDVLQSACAMVDDASRRTDPTAETRVVVVVVVMCLLADEKLELQTRAHRACPCRKRGGAYGQVVHRCDLKQRHAADLPGYAHAYGGPAAKTRGIDGSPYIDARSNDVFYGCQGIIRPCGTGCASGIALRRRPHIDQKNLGYALAHRIQIDRRNILLAKGAARAGQVVKTAKQPVY